MTAIQETTQLKVLQWKFTNLAHLVCSPINRASIENSVQKILQDKYISKQAKAWLEFIAALIRWQRRFDVEVEEASQGIDAKEFDIEIEV